MMTMTDTRNKKLSTHINAPHSTAVKEEWPCFANFPDVRQIPHVQAVVVVYTRQLVVDTAVADSDRVWIPTVCWRSSNSSEIIYSTYYFKIFLLLIKLVFHFLRYVLQLS